MDIDTMALICAKGASRDIPNKNIKMLGGKPLIAWTIEAAVESKVCQSLCVASDSREIRAIANNRGVVSMSLLKSMVADSVYSAEVYRFVLRELIATDFVPKTVIILQPTSPFRTGKHIAEAYELYGSGPGTVMAVTRNKKYYWRNYPWKGMEPQNIEPGIRQVRQLTPDDSWLYEECGSIYITSVEEFLRTGHYHNRPYIPYIMPEEASLEIDTPYHWWLAEKWIEWQAQNV